MDAQLAAAPDGQHLVAAWTTAGTQDRFGRGPIATAVSADGGATWAPGPNPADDGLSTGHAFLDLACDAKGSFHLVWLDGRNAVAADRAIASAEWAQMPNRGFHLDLAYLERMVRYVQRRGWDIVSLDEALRRLATPGQRRFVNVSLDDCYRDTAEQVVPLFARLGAPITLFVTTGIPDSENGRFAELGWAKEFRTSGELERTVTWTIGETGGAAEPSPYTGAGRYHHDGQTNA